MARGGAKGKQAPKQLNEKGKNRFKFVPFSERVANIKINVVHRVGAVAAQPEDADCFFAEGVAKWRELNCTGHFQAFLHEAGNSVHSLAQLVFFKDRIVDALLRHLAVPNSMAVEPLLDLLVQTARDLRDEFYGYFPRTFGVLVALLETRDEQGLHDPEIIEHTFTTLSYLFKFLTKYLVRDIDEVFGLYSSLLGPDQKPHTRHFAAESFAFLVRKVPQRDSAGRVAHLLRAVEANPSPEFCDGVGALLFETVKGVQHQFHSRVEELLQTYIAGIVPLCPDGDASDGLVSFGIGAEGRAAVFSTISACVRRMAEHTRREHCAAVFSLLLNRLSAFLSRYNSVASEVEEGRVDDAHLREWGIALGRMASLVCLWVEHRDGSRVTSVDALYACLVPLLVAIGPSSTTPPPSDTRVVRLPAEAAESCVLLAAATLAFSGADLALARGPPVVAAIADRASLGLVRALCGRLLSGDSAAATFAPLCLTHVVSCLDRHAHHEPLQTVAFLSQLVESVDWVGVASAAVTKRRRLKFPATASNNAAQASDDSPQTHASASPKSKTSKQKKTESKKTGDGALRRSLETAVANAEGRPRHGVVDLLVATCASFDPHIVRDEATQAEELPLLVAALTCLRHAEVPFESTYGAIESLVTRLLAAASQARARDPALHPPASGGREPFAEWSRAALPSADVQRLLAAAGCALSTLVSLLRSYKGDDGESLSARAPFFRQAMAEFGWDRHVLAAVDDFYDALHGACGADVFPSSSLVGILMDLRANLTSPSRALRTSTLRILARHQQLDALSIEGDEKGMAPEPCACFEVCLAAERCDASLEEYRERLVHLGRLQQMATLGRLPELYAEVPARYLLAQLYVNFRPLWAPVMDMLGKVATAGQATFWGVFLPILREAYERARVVNGPRVSVNLALAFHARDGTSPSASDLAVANAAAHGDLVSRFNALSDEGLDGRADYANFHALLWETLHTSASAIAERHSRDLVPMFLDFIDAEFNVLFEGSDLTQDLSRPPAVVVDDEDDADGKKEGGVEEESEEESMGETKRERRASVGSAHERDGADAMEVDEPEGTAAATSAPHATSTLKGTRDRSEVGLMRKGAMRKLTQCLTLFSKFANPKALYRTDRLHALYHDFVMRSDVAVQQLALACVLTYRHPQVYPYKEHLERLTSEHEFRDGLAAFDVDEESGAVSRDHRPTLMPLVMRILFARMTRRKKGGKNSLAARRATVFAFLTGCSEAEIEYFISILLEPFAAFVNEAQGEGVLHIAGEPSVAAAVPLRKQLGYLNAVGDVVAKMRTRVEPFLRRLLWVALRLARDASVLLSPSHRNSIAAAFVAPLREVRLVGTRRIAEVFDIFPAADYAPFVPALFASLVSPRLPRLKDESLHRPSGVLELLEVWSRHARLALLLVHDPTALPSAFCCLAARTVSEQVISHVLGIAENMLALEDNGDDDITNAVVRPNVGHLLESLHAMVFAAASSSSHAPATQGAAKPAKPASLGRFSLASKFHRRALNVLSRISDHATDPEKAGALANLLLPFLRPQGGSGGTLPAATRADVLGIVRSAYRLAQPPSAHLSFLSGLFALLSHRAARTELCGAFEAAARWEPWLVPVVPILRGLNAYNPRAVDEPDYDTRLAAFAGFNERSYAELDARQLLPIVQNLVFFAATSDDFSLRDNAIFGLLKVVSRIASSCRALGFSGCVNPTDATDPTHGLYSLLAHVILPAVKRAMRSTREGARNEFVSVLALAVREMPEDPNFGDLSCLAGDGSDEESSFFLNVRHIQTHRRVRALRRMAECCREGRLGARSLTNFILPLVSHMLVEVGKQSDHNLAREAVDAVGAACGRLGWGQYYGQLSRLLKVLADKPGNAEKTVMRAVVAVLDSFHFDLAAADNSVATEELMRQRAQEKAEAERRAAQQAAVDSAKANKRALPRSEGKSARFGGNAAEEEKGGDEAAGRESDAEGEGEGAMEVDGAPTTKAMHAGTEASSATRILTVVVNKILPDLHRYLTTKDGESDVLRVPVALAMTKLLLKVPDETRRALLPGLLTRVCHVLRDREQNVRDVARDTLVKIAATLGQMYLPFILQELKGSLERGYQRHVLGFTVHALLEDYTSNGPEPRVGGIDHCVDKLLVLLDADLFGETAEEKEVAQLASKSKEAKAKKGFDSFELLASVVSFERVPALLVPVREHLAATDSLKEVRKCEEILRRIAQGARTNPSATPQALLVFVHGLLSSESVGRRELERARKAAEREKSSSVRTPKPSDNDHLLIAETPGRSKNPQAHAATNAHLVCEFALSLLHSALKHGSVDGRTLESLQMLDPFVPLLRESLESRQARTIVLSLKCLGILARMPLPSLETAAGAISDRVFKLINKAGVGSNGTELVQGCFRLMAVLLRDVRTHTITDNQLRLLLSRSGEDLEDSERQAVSFSLLKAIVARKLVVPELYDIVDRVAELMIRSPSPAVRELCSQVVLQFVLDYPLGAKRLRAHLDFLVRNIAYEHETGRLAALSMLDAVVRKFPEDIVRDNAEFFFVPLVVRLVGDESSRCREAVAAAIKQLLSRVDASRADSMHAMVVKWLSDPRPAVRRSALQVCGLFVEVETAGYARRLRHTLPLVCACLRDAVEALHRAAEEDPNGDAPADDRWELPYFALTVLSKALAAVPDVLSAVEFNGAVWEDIVHLLLHPHAWVRLASCRLLGTYFSRLDPATFARPGSPAPKKKALLPAPTDLSTVAGWDYVRTAGVGMRLARALCRQLESPFLDDTLGDQVVKNLFFVGRGLYAQPELNPPLPKGTGRKRALDGGGDEEEEDAEEDADMARDAPADDGDGPAANGAGGDGDEDDGAMEVDGNGGEGGAVGRVSEQDAAHEEKERARLSGLTWLFKRLSFLARAEAAKNPRDSRKRLCVFKWFGAMCSHLGASAVLPFLEIALAALHQVLNDTAGVISDESLRGFAQEVVDMLRGLVGPTAFFARYHAVRERAAKSRAERKRRRVVAAIVDPALHADRRIRKNALKKKSRKRKMDAFKATHSKRARSTQVDDDDDF